MTSTIEDILDKVRDCLLVGDTAALSGLDVRLAAAAEALLPISAEQAMQLRHKAERNARLLHSASLGFRSAHERVTDIARGPMLSTYDAAGRKAMLLGPVKALGRY